MSRIDSLTPCGGDWSLVASLVFNTMDAQMMRVVGSIPIHLRQIRRAGQYAPILHNEDVSCGRQI
jgi:hypothetical protein